jgi:hypothetical protein
MADIFDLFGDPVPANHGKRGRPEHVPTQDNRNTISMLLALDWSNERIANALNITPPTLRKHYSSQLRLRHAARDRLEAKTAMTFWQQFQGGNTGAGREFVRLVERNDMAVGLQPRAAAPAAEADNARKLGKKEQLNREAQTAHQDTGWGGLLQ